MTARYRLCIGIPHPSPFHPWAYLPVSTPDFQLGCISVGHHLPPLLPGAVCSEGCCPVNSEQSTLSAVLPSPEGRSSSLLLITVVILAVGVAANITALVQPNGGTADRVLRTMLPTSPDKKKRLERENSSRAVLNPAPFRGFQSGLFKRQYTSCQHLWKKKISVSNRGLLATIGIAEHPCSTVIVELVPAVLVPGSFRCRSVFLL